MSELMNGRTLFMCAWVTVTCFLAAHYPNTAITMGVLMILYYEIKLSGVTR
jgi:hypothetical protein